MKLPKVSIIVPAYNEEKDIPKLLDSLLKVRYPKNKYEIIVVDDGSTDRTVKIVEKYPVKLIKTRHRGVAHAKNKALKVAKGNIILFFGADTVVDKNYLKEITKFYSDKKIGGSDGIEFTLNENSLISRIMYLRRRLIWSKFVISRALRKKLFDEVGYHNKDYGCFDDREISERILKAGYKLVRLPKAKCWHKDPENIRELYRKCVWEGKSMVYMLRKLKVEGLRRMLFPIFTALLPVYVLFLFLQFPLWLFGLTGIILFLFIELRRSLEMYNITKIKESFLTPLFDFVSMFMVCIGMLIGLVSRSKPKV